MSRKEANPLGNVAKFYLEKNRSGIFLNKKNKTLEFYPYSFISKNRQKVLKNIWDISAQNNREDLLYPLNNIVYHNIKLVQEKAYILVILESPIKYIDVLNNKILGYVPARIKTHLWNNLSMFNEGKILRIRNKWCGNYYTSKIILFYDKKHRMPFDQATRFLNVINEI